MTWPTCSYLLLFWPVAVELPEGEPHYAFARPTGKAWTLDWVAHSFACRKLRAGVNLYAVPRLLRHASIAMAERYTRLSGEELKTAVNRKPVSSPSRDL